MESTRVKATSAMPNTPSNSVDEIFFLYKLGAKVPDHVTHLRVHNSIQVILAYMLYGLYYLNKMVLPEGLLETGEEVLCECCSLEHINLPSILTKNSNDAISCFIALK